MSKNGGTNDDKLINVLLINIFVLTVAFMVLLCVYFNDKRKLSQTQESVFCTETVEYADPREAIYQKALSFLAEEKKNVASRYFKQISGYKDSDEYVQRIADYTEGVNAFNEWKVEKAKQYLTACDNLYECSYMINDCNLLILADIDIQTGCFDEEDEETLYKNIAVFPKDGVRYYILRSKAKAMMYLGSKGEKEEVGIILADICKNVDWLKTLGTGGEYTDYRDKTGYYGSPDDVAVSAYVYGPLYNSEGNVFFYYRDESANDYYYGLNFGYMDQGGNMKHIFAYYERDGQLKCWLD